MSDLPKMDKKFYGDIYKAKNDMLVPPDEWCVFLAKDNAFYAILPEYMKQCRDRGCDDEQIAAIEAMYWRVVNWRKANPGRCKDPDAHGEKLLG